MPAPSALSPEHLEQLQADHGLTEAAAESEAWDAWGRHRFGVSWRQGYRTAWWAAVTWLLEQQMQVDELTEGQMLAELRKGPASIYWPIKADDPRFYADCPRCRRPVLIDARGLCDTCAYEFEEDRSL